MKDNRWYSWNRKKQSKDRRHFRRITTVEAPSLFFYTAHIVPVLCRMAYLYYKKEDFFKPWQDMLDINAIRKVTYYIKKHKHFDLSQIYLSYYTHPRYMEVRIFFKALVEPNIYEKYMNQCVVATGLKSIKLEKGRGYYNFVLFGGFEPNKNMEIDKVKMAIGTCPKNIYYWNFADNPHLLITGTTGSGKTNTLNIVIQSIIYAGYQCSLIDDKGIDYIDLEEYLEDYLNTVKHGYGQIFDLIMKYERIMDTRLNTLREKRQKKYIDVDDMPPCFLIIEEFSSLISKVDTKARKEFMNYMGRVLQKGRTVGVNIIICMQRPDTSILPGELRSNLTTRIVCGANEDMTYQMVFDKVLEPLEIGFAYANQGIDLNIISLPEYKEMEVLNDSQDN